MKRNASDGLIRDLASQGWTVVRVDKSKSDNIITFLCTGA